jgi:hypothetical protein
VTDSSDNLKMRERSGTVKSRSNLVAFFYELLRDHAPSSVETIARNSDHDTEWIFTNGWVACYAKDLVKRLLFLPKELETLDYILKVVNEAQLADGDGQKRFDAVALIEKLRNP